MFHKNGSTFCKKSLDIYPFFTKKSLAKGLFFKLYMNPENLAKLVCFFKKKIPRNGYLLLEKSLEWGTYFQKNYPYIWVWVLSLRRYTPDQTKSECPHEIPQSCIKMISIGICDISFIIRNMKNTK